MSFSSCDQALREPPLTGASPSPSSWDAASGLFDGLSSSLRGLVVPERLRAQDPPLVEAWVGDRPRSFPLQLKHAGRSVISMDATPFGMAGTAGYKDPGPFQYLLWEEAGPSKSCYC